MLSLAFAGCRRTKLAQLDGVRDAASDGAEGAAPAAKLIPGRDRHWKALRGAREAALPIKAKAPRGRPQSCLLLYESELLVRYRYEVVSLVELRGCLVDRVNNDQLSAGSSARLR